MSPEHCRRAIFQIYNVQNPKITRITTFRFRNVVYQAGSRWDPKFVFNFLRFFFERTLYKSNYVIFILSWWGTRTKIRSKLVDIVTAGSQKITLWGPRRTPLAILRVNRHEDRRWVGVAEQNLRAVCQVSGKVRWLVTVSYDQICKVTGEWRKLHNEKLKGFGTQNADFRRG